MNRIELRNKLMNCKECTRYYCNNCADIKMLEAMGELND